MMKEHELKLILKEQDYKQIISSYQKENVILQTNHYFDTLNFDLYKNNITLRARIEKEIIQLTLKLKIHSKDNITHSLEYNQEITSNILEELINIPGAFSSVFNLEIKNVLSNFGIDPSDIIYIGKIRNTRTILHGFDDLIFHLDKTIFPENIIEFELEIENIENSNVVLEKLKRTFKIDIIQNNTSKYNRFINHLLQNTN